jgi:hypothetical protein
MAIGSGYDTLEERNMDLGLAGKAKGFVDYPVEPKCEAVEQNAPATSPRRPRPIVCIADGCYCSFVTDEVYEAGIPRELLPIGCAAL